MESVEPASNAKGIRSYFSIPAPAPSAAIPRASEQIVWNLLANAVKFTPEKGSGGRPVPRFSWKFPSGTAGYCRDFFRMFSPFALTTPAPAGGCSLVSPSSHLVELHGGSVRPE